MNCTHRASAALSVLLGLFLLVEGIWGLKSPVVFGLLTTNWLHACIHILLGLVGLAAGLRGGGRGFCLFVGWLLLLVGVIFVVPVATDFVTPLHRMSLSCGLCGKEARGRCVCGGAGRCDNAPVVSFRSLLNHPHAGASSY